MTDVSRQPQHQIDPQFHRRWSSRAFNSEAVPDAVLFSALEAARWAPSGGNGQPWRFIYVKRDHPEWQRFIGLLNERNRVWASRAGALVLLLSRKVKDGPDGPVPARTHAFDAGAAWSNFAHQAHLLGWGTRAMAGFDAGATRAALDIPDVYEPQIFIAIGRVGDRELLPADFRESDPPNGRQPLSALVSEARFSFG